MGNLSSIINQYRYQLVFAFIALAYLFNMQLDVMDVDASQYASISMEMWQNKSFLQVFHRGNDYLDKPPLLLWFSSISMGLFGFNNFAYKLPSILVLILGIYSTFRFAKLYYTSTVALNAALLVAASNALFLVSNDVRTDGMLTGFTIFAVWQLSAFLKSKSKKAFLLAALGVGLAMLTKGPIALGILGLGLSAHLVIKKQWKEIFHVRWILFALIVLLILSPMLYGLYTQFDMHPEKEAYGLKGPSGILFYFYTQSFGRLTGDIYWDNNTGPFFFVGSILWDYQPLVLLFIPAFVWRFIALFKGDKQEEDITLFGFLLPFMALSASNYKLPHYVFPLLPFAAIIACSWINADKAHQGVSWFLGMQKAIVLLYPIIAVLALIYFFDLKTYSTLLALIPLSIGVYFLFKKKSEDSWAVGLASMAAFLGIITSTYFYPNLLQYQSTSVAGKMVAKQDDGKLFHLGAHGHALDFYSRQIAASYDRNTAKKGDWIYTNEAGLERVKQDFESLILVKPLPHYHITILKPSFLLRSERQKILKTRYLVKL